MNDIERKRINEIIAELGELPTRSSFVDGMSNREIIKIEYARHLEGLIFEARQIIKKLDNSEDYLKELDKLEVNDNNLGAYYDDYDKVKTTFSHVLSSIANYELNINNASSDSIPISSATNQQNNKKKRFTSLPWRSISLGITIISWLIFIPWTIYDWQRDQIPFEGVTGFLFGLVAFIGYFYTPDRSEDKNSATSQTTSASGTGIAAGHDLDIKDSTVITGPIIMSSKRPSTLEEELTQLVSPLYAKLNKNDEIIYFMTTYKISRIWTYDKSKIAELEKLEEDIKEIMLQHGPLAQDQLYQCIKTFLNLRPEWEQRNSYEAKKVLWNISKIVKDRQDELRAKLKNP
jgi:hypothetical protein